MTTGLRASTLIRAMWSALALQSYAQAVAGNDRDDDRRERFERIAERRRRQAHTFKRAAICLVDEMQPEPPAGDL